MSSEHVEVLRHMKETIKAIMPSEVAALDAAIAALSAPQPPADTTVCTGDEIRCHDGHGCECAMRGQPPAEAQGDWRDRYMRLVDALDRYAQHGYSLEVASPVQQPAAEAQAQGGGEVVAEVCEDQSGSKYTCWSPGLKPLPPAGTKLYAAPSPNASVAVEGPLSVFSAGEWQYSETGQTFSAADLDEAAFVVYRDHLAQQPTAAGELAELVGLLDEVRSHFTRDDDLPDDLLPRIDAALRWIAGGES